MHPGQLVASYKFWDIAPLWAAERLDNELVVARALARGIIVDGLRFHSVDSSWVKPARSLTGFPYVGYAADAQKPPVLLKAEVLEHLLAVVRQAAVPSRQILKDEFVLREDFAAWIKATRQMLPGFWFGDDERGAA